MVSLRATDEDRDLYSAVVGTGNESITVGAGKGAITVGSLQPSFRRIGCLLVPVVVFIRESVAVLPISRLCRPTAIGCEIDVQFSSVASELHLNSIKSRVSETCEFPVNSIA